MQTYAIIYRLSNVIDNRDEMTEAESQQAQEKKARGEKTAENVRYGEAISEHGMGGETLTSGGVAGEQGTFDLSGLIGIQPGWDSDVLTCWRLVRIAGFGRKKVADGDVDAEQSRKVQGYGPGSGVGA